MTLILGIDEAGRGPVLGPLVMAGVLIDSKDEKKLVKLGVKDSKQLTEKKRNELFGEIKKIVKSFEIISVQPDEIDDALAHPSMNLNWLEAKTSAKIVNKLKPDKAILDCPSTNPKAYEQYFKNLLKNKKIKLVVEHKADENYPVASAASILAKVTRDKAIEDIKKLHGDCGSGYPADEKTVKFLKKNYKKLKHLFRQSWESYKNVKKTKEQKSLANF